jgi:hypothetical protein
MELISTKSAMACFSIYNGDENDTTNCKYVFLEKQFCIRKLIKTIPILLITEALKL